MWPRRHRLVAPSNADDRRGGTMRALTGNASASGSATDTDTGLVRPAASTGAEEATAAVCSTRAVASADVAKVEIRHAPKLASVCDSQSLARAKASDAAPAPAPARGGVREDDL